MIVGGSKGQKDEMNKENNDIKRLLMKMKR